MELLPLFKQCIESNNLFSNEHHLLVACSGGMDSVVLLHLLNSLRYHMTILHCNFQLRGEESDRDERFVRELAASMNIPCIIQHFDTKDIMKIQKKGLQETARNIRYEWFKEQMNRVTAQGLKPLLLTAHHLDDQCETIAFNFFRGTGIAGLTGMKLKDKDIVRPLLFAGKQDMERYATLHQLIWVEDQSNKESFYARNQFRNDVFPTIEKVIPSFRHNLSQNLKRFQEVEKIYRQHIALMKKKMIEKRGETSAIAVNKLKAVTPLDTIIFEIFSDFGFAASQIEALKKMIHAATGSHIDSATHRVLKNRNWLLIDPIHQTCSEILLIAPDDKKILFHNGTLEIAALHQCQAPSSSANEAWLDADKVVFPLLLRMWKRGDYFYPLGMKKKKKISKFLIDQKLSKTEKDAQFIIESDKKIIWVVGKRIDDRFKLLPSTKNILKLTLR